MVARTRSLPGDGHVATHHDRGPRLPVTPSSSGIRSPQESDDGINDPSECIRRQHGELTRDEILTGGEQRAGASLLKSAVSVFDEHTSLTYILRPPC